MEELLAEVESGRRDSDLALTTQIGRQERDRQPLAPQYGGDDLADCGESGVAQRTVMEEW